MSGKLGLDEIVALVFDECRYDELRPKAVHKILYFANKELEKERVHADLPLFWYMYGAVAATSNSDISVIDGNSGKKVECTLDPSDIDADEPTVRRGRRAVRRALEPYYEGGIEGITDAMYREAPYDVQRQYRDLDQQLQTAADDGQMTLDGGKNEQRTRETLYDFVGAFPEAEFPEFSEDLSIWYRLMSTEIDSNDYDPERAHELAQTFWRLFCLELACRENNGLSREDIAREVNDVDSVEQGKHKIRAELLELEREKAQNNATGDETALKAAEAFVIPHLDFPIKPYL